MKPRTPKASLWAATAPFLCLLPLNTASVILQDILTSHDVNVEYSKGGLVIIGLIAIFLSILLGHLCFRLRKNLSLKSTLFVQIILTAAFVDFQIIIISARLTEGFIFLCFLCSSLIWPLLNLRYQIYLHECSLKSSPGLIYSSAIYMQILPGMLGKMIIGLQSPLDARPLRHFYNIQYAYYIMAFVISLILYQRTCSSIPKKLLVEASLEAARPNHSDNKFTKRIFLYLIVAAFVDAVTPGKSNVFLSVEYNTQPNIYALAWISQGSSLEVFIYSFCLIARVFLVTSAGKFLHKSNKTKILHIILVLFFLARISWALEFDLEYLYLFIMWGLNDLIYLVIQVIISEDHDGSAGLFFVSNIFFSLTNLKKMACSLSVGYDWLILVILVILPIIMFVCFSKASQKISQTKTKL